MENCELNKTFNCILLLLFKIHCKNTVMETYWSPLCNYHNCKERLKSHHSHQGKSTTLFMEEWTPRMPHSLRVERRADPPTPIWSKWKNIPLVLPGLLEVSEHPSTNMPWIQGPALWPWSSSVQDSSTDRQGQDLRNKLQHKWKNKFPAKQIYHITII